MGDGISNEKRVLLIILWGFFEERRGFETGEEGSWEQLARN